MADDKGKPGAQDRARINSNEDHELRDGSQKGRVKPQQFKSAFEAVGTHAQALTKRLKGRAQ